MVVVSLQPTFRYMERSGIANGTREVARRLWNGKLPKRDPAKLVRELYNAENHGKKSPSGSQDMVGLIYPGISRLDYDFNVHDGIFPAHIESVDNTRTVRWLEQVLHLIPVAPRPAGYNPLGQENLAPQWISRLGQTGKDCFEAIRCRNVNQLGASLNDCMDCWERILPGTVRHRTIRLDLMALLRVYRAKYPGAMYSGCGGGYLIVVSEKPVPGSLSISVRTARD